jgi:putative DNA primase/helicase
MLRLDRGSGDRELLAHSPERFNVYSLPFDYDENADAPAEWLRVLDSLDVDDDVIELIQEWFGFVISGDMSKSKMLYLYGNTRAGKGVITRTLQQLVGRGNFVSPNLSQFGETFGLQPTIGKTLITINDARFRGIKTAELVERLLNFTGADDMTINRKNRDPWQGRPSARVMIVSNDLPNVTGEQSTAFAKRILGPVYLHKSFYNHEDEDLERRLRRELSQIAMWAFDGYDRLCEAERFTTPRSSKRLHREVEESMSPVLGFVRERCEPAHDGFVSKDRLYRAFIKWAEEAGLYVPSKIEFGRQLRGAVGERLGESKMQAGKGQLAREHCWRGIVLRDTEAML